MKIRPDQLQQLISQARAGQQLALESLIRAIQPNVYALALRFLMHPQDAEDRTQEILLKVTTRLNQFNGDSQFSTWVYRLASNHLLDSLKSNNVVMMTFDEFSEDLANGLELDANTSAYEEQLISEVRIGCTQALLQCLTPELRLSYILGEILELDHQQAAQVQHISSASFRKRLSRARESVNEFMQSNCGLIESINPCRCHNRVKPALSLNRISRKKTVFSSAIKTSKEFPEVLQQIRSLQHTQRAVALYKAQQPQIQSETFIKWLRQTLNQSSTEETPSLH